VSEETPAEFAERVTAERNAKFDEFMRRSREATSDAKQRYWMRRAADLSAGPLNLGVIR
jgi:hypothetical protein